MSLLSGTLEPGAPARVLKQNHGTTVTLVSLPGGAVVVKHHRLDTWRRWGDALLQGSPARRAWHGAQLLQAWGFPVPQPLAVVEKRVAGTVRESVYCCEGLLTQVPLDVYWRERQQHWPLQQRRTFLRALAEFLRTFHAAGLYAGDLRDANLLVEEQGDTHWKFYLVDLDRVVHHAPLGQRRRLKNLVQLERTLGRSARVSERLFFLYHYLGNPLPSQAQRRALLRRLVRLRKRKDREYARRRARQAHQQPGTASPSQPGTAPARALISCCIVCCNEETNIRRCLESVKWCDEIVVVDSFSDKKVGDCMVPREKMAALELTTLPDRVLEAVRQGAHTRMPVYEGELDNIVGIVNTKDLFYLFSLRGVAVLDDALYPALFLKPDETMANALRLFRKAKARWGGVDPHEKVLLLRGPVDRLHGNLYHYTYTDISDHLRTVNAFTEVTAREQPLRGKHARVSDLLWRPFWRFLRFYVLRGTIRDGVPGFFVAVTAAFYGFLKYAKLWEYSTLTRDARAQDSARRPRAELGRGRGPGSGAHQVSPPLGSSFRRGR